MSSVLGGGFFPGYGIVYRRLSPLLAMELRNDPMICKIHAKVTKPILSDPSLRSFQVIDQGAGDKVCAAVKEAVDQDLKSILELAMPAAAESPCFGYFLSEIVYGKANGRIAPVDICPVLPGEAILHVDPTRRFTGFELFGQWRDARYAFLCVHDEHFDRVLGRSLNEAAVISYFRSLASAETGDKLERRASGIQFLFHVMQGVQVVDANGNPIDGIKLVTEYMNAAVLGKSGIVPDMFFPKEAIEANPELAKIPYFRAEQFDWGNNGPAMVAAMQRQTRFDTEKFAAWGVPERAVAEASHHGGFADADAQSDVVMCISEQMHSNIVRQFNNQVTNVWKGANYADAKLLVQAVAGRLTDPQQKFHQALITARIQATVVDPAIDSNVDWRKELELSGISLVSPEDAAERQSQAEAKQAADNAAKLEALKQSKQSNDTNPKVDPEDKP